MLHSTRKRIYEEEKAFREQGIRRRNTGGQVAAFLFLFMIIFMGLVGERMNQSKLAEETVGITWGLRVTLLLIVIALPLIVQEWIMTLQRNDILFKQYQKLRNEFQESQAELNESQNEMAAYQTILDVILQDTIVSAEILDTAVKQDEMYRELRRHTLSMIDRLNYFQENRFHPKQ